MVWNAGNAQPMSLLKVSTLKTIISPSCQLKSSTFNLVEYLDTVVEYLDTQFLTLKWTFNFN